MTTNTCDSCKKVEKSEELIWITADDFEPKKGEYITVEMYQKYDALCESCYYKLVEN